MKPNLTKSTLAFTFCCFISINLCFAQKPSKADYLSQYLYRYDHVGINIRNLQKSADWYKNVLGFHVLHKWKTTWMVGNKTMKIGLFQRPDAKKIDSLDNTIAITHFAFFDKRSRLKKNPAIIKNEKHSIRCTGGYWNCLFNFYI